MSPAKHCSSSADERAVEDGKIVLSFGQEKRRFLS